MKKVGKMFSRLIIFGLMLAILYMLVKGRTSNYHGGSPLDVIMGKAASAGPSSIFDIKSDLKCAPGPSKDSAYYTQDLTPGGLCGDQTFVRDQMRDWTIGGGIGGSLLDRLA
jgi:hypothetical protein